MTQFNLLNRYEFDDIENGYSFTTDDGNTYFVYFIEYPLIDTLPDGTLFTFNIERLDDNNHRNGSEQKVRNTILHILASFFEKHERAILSVCDITDGRQKVRKRLFDKWYNDFGATLLEKREAPVIVEGNITYSMLYYRRDNIYKSLLEDGFDELVAVNFYNE